MTHLFHVGEPASTRSGSPLVARGGEARAVVGPGGIQIVIVVDEPSRAQQEAVETGAVSLGVVDGPRASALLVRVGEPGRQGHIEAEAEIEAGIWWGADVELALCDGLGIVRAVCRFRGPTAGSSSE